jgi:endonuclease/exonuclease/phosphatase family metal-dependent hydrolase
MQESRQYVLTCAVAVLCATTAPLYAQSEPQAGDRPLRVMSYNIKHGQTNASCTQPAPVPGSPPNPDCNLDIEKSIAVIRSLNPDIVGMQEIDRFWARSAYMDEPAVIGDALGYEFRCYAPNLDHGPDNHSPVPHQYGTVILSRFPIVECTNTLLPRVATEEQRGLTMAVINVRGVPLQFFNTHLHTTQAARLLQTARVAEVLDAAPDGPKVVMGDFNARPTAVEMVPVQDRLLDAWVKAPLPDAVNPNGFTSPADVDRDPTSRIDYVFGSQDLGFAGTFVPLDDETRLAADHYPVVADITLPGAAVGVGEVLGSSPSPE